MKRSFIRLAVMVGALFVLLTPVEAQTEYCIEVGASLCDYWCGQWGNWFAPMQFDMWWCCLPGEVDCYYYYTYEGCCW